MSGPHLTLTTRVIHCKLKHSQLQHSIHACLVSDMYWALHLYDDAYRVIKYPLVCVCYPHV